MSQGGFFRYATLHQIVRQDGIPQRSNCHFFKCRFRRLRQTGRRLFQSDSRHIGGFRYESRLHHEVVALQKLPRKREDVAALSQAEVVPEMFCHVHAEEGVRSPRYGARYHNSFPLRLTGLYPNLARKSARGIRLIMSMSVCFIP